MQGRLVHLGNAKLQACYTPGAQPAVVFVHGGLGTRFAWRSQWEFLRQRGQCAVAYDLAGHGDSSSYRRYSIGRYRRDLARLLDYFQINRPIVCCHSYGVPIGLEWAARQPTAALVLIGGGTHDLTPWWEIPLVKGLEWGGYWLYRIPSLRRWLYSLTSQHTSDTVQQFLHENPMPQTPHPFQAMAAFWGYDGRHAYIRCPIWVITGEQDPVFPPSMGAKLVAHFSHYGSSCQHYTVPETGHLVMAEAPNAVNHLLADVLHVAG